MKKRIALLLVLILIFTNNVYAYEYSYMRTEPHQQITSQEKDKQRNNTTETAWDLKDLYENEKEFGKKLLDAHEQIDKIAVLKGKLNTIANVVACYKLMDELNAEFNRLSAYAYLQVTKDQSDSKAKELYGKVNGISLIANEKISFALPEIFSNTPAFLDSVAKAKEMKPYLNWFLRERAEREHQLSEREEQLMLPTYRLRDGANSLYDTLVNSEIQFPKLQLPDGEAQKADEMGYSSIHTGQYSQKLRLDFYDSMMGAYRQYRGTLAQNYQNYCVAVVENARLRGYNSALEAELATTGTPLAVYSGILEAAEQAQPTLERYLALCKKELGVDQLYSFDAGVPFVKSVEREFSYEDGKEIVIDSLSVLGDDYAQKLSQMFDQGRIDVYPQVAKEGGAFTMNVANLHPYILLNYTNNFESVSTLAHELGHAVHMQYSQNQKSNYDANPTGLTSEVTSLLNQILVSDYMIKNAKTEEERRYYSTEQMAFLMSAFYGQAFFARFQDETVDVVEAGGTLTADKLDELWISTTKECYGDTYKASENYCGEWARIPHFYYGFYVYQYAVGVGAACEIADKIQSGDPHALEDYINFLKAGDSTDAVTLLEIAGVDIRSGDYSKGLIERLEGLISEYES